MDWFTAIVPAASALLGAVVGAVATLLASKHQHDREVAAQRAQQVTVRGEQAAERLIELVTELERDIVAEHRDRPEDRDRPKRIRQLLAEMSTLALLLPGELRVRLRFYRLVFERADAIGADGSARKHYHPTYRIVRAVADAAREELAAHLCNRALPSPSEFVTEYRAALDDYAADLAEDYGVDAARYEDEQKSWRAMHPNVSATDPFTPGAA